MYQRRTAAGRAVRGPAGSRGPAAASDRPAAPRGNHAFDEYRAETLRRLEEEQKEFASFLERLRFAKDKAEFDQFMAERRSRPPARRRTSSPRPEQVTVALSGTVLGQRTPDLRSCRFTRSGSAHRFRLAMHPVSALRLHQ